MNTPSRIITGTVAILIGVGLTVLGIVKILPALFYGIPILIIGILIFFNRKEDEIEKINKK